MWTEPKTWAFDEVVDETDMNTHVRDNFRGVLPIATLIMRVAPYTDVETTVESRWLQCNGVAVSRATYAALFNYLNALSPALPFGVGDGSSTFNLPDMRGRAPFGQGTQADVDALGDNEGAALAYRGPQHRHVIHLSANTGNAGNLVVGSSKDTGETASPQAVGPFDGNVPTEKFSYLTFGSYFIKYTA